jgi:hypothetical protein
MIFDNAVMFFFTKVLINKYKIEIKSTSNTNISSPGPAKLVGAALCETYSNKKPNK